MAYCTIDDVKDRLNIKDTSEDSTLANKLTAADAYIDTKLKKYTTVPLASVPQIIKDASADLAAAMFREDRFETEAVESIEERSRASIFRNRAEAALDSYIKETYCLHVLQKIEVA